MPFDYVLLKTDALFYTLCCLTILYSLYARRREHLRTPWRQVGHNKIAVLSAIILSCFLTIALLDSIHYHPALKDPRQGTEVRYATELISLLDRLVEPLRTRTETSYSAPFSAYAYNQETIELDNGQTILDYPRLKYGGAHLDTPETERLADIGRHALIGLLKGIGIGGLLALGLLLWRSRRRGLKGLITDWKTIRHDRSQVPWRLLYSTLAVLLILTLIGAELSLKYHILGTDKIGTDVLYKSLKSIRTGLLIGSLTTLVVLPFALIFGVMAGYFRGWIDDLIQYLYTTLSAIPGVLLIAASALILEIYMAKHASDFGNLAARADLRLLFLCLILGITNWTDLCRLLRGETLKLRAMDFIEAARALGVSHVGILSRHIIPNMMHIVIIAVVMSFSGLVLAEAVLTYINIGVDPSMESWGNMINNARLELARQPVVWWSLFAAFSFMFILVLSANLFADAVRDAFDPRLRKD